MSPNTQYVHQKDIDANMLYFISKSKPIYVSSEVGAKLAHVGATPGDDQPCTCLRIIAYEVRDRQAPCFSAAALALVIKSSGTTANTLRAAAQPPSHGATVCLHLAEHVAHHELHKHVGCHVTGHPCSARRLPWCQLPPPANTCRELQLEPHGKQPWCIVACRNAGYL